MRRRISSWKYVALALMILMLSSGALVQTATSPKIPRWAPDLGNSQYKNPVLYADYSDPDAVRVGGDFWLTSSSFSHVPGLPILHSRDLVNWTIVNHALQRLVPDDFYSEVRHGGGVWAPSIRYHDSKYWIYYPDPDFGIYVVTADDPRGKWSAPVLVKAGKGLIDPCPLWDDDGRVWLVHAWARSRSGKNNILSLVELAPDGRHIKDPKDEGRVIVDGANFNDMHTLEGPKFYKLNGWYYIFAPTGGVAGGVQSVFRSREISGPYEHRVVMTQGSTNVNGPHQGALVDAPDGKWWFLHFQDKGAYGRIVHLQPVEWKDGWPIIGISSPSNPGVGEPVTTFSKPIAGQVAAVPQTSDEFSATALGLQWQWQANPKQDWAILRNGKLRLRAVPLAQDDSLYSTAPLLLQKFPAEEFDVVTKLEHATAGTGNEAGLIVFGDDYVWVGVSLKHDGGWVVQQINRDASKGGKERTAQALRIKLWPLYLSVTVRQGGVCHFAYSYDGLKFTPIGEEFIAKQGRWVGAKVGIFAASMPISRDIPAKVPSYGDFDFFRVSGPRP